MKEKDKQQTVQITMIMKMTNACDLQFLKEVKKLYEKDYSQYEAIGIIDGNPLYYQTLKYKEALLKRITALTELVATIRKTNKTIIQAQQQNTHTA